MPRLPRRWRRWACPQPYSCLSRELRRRGQISPCLSSIVGGLTEPGTATFDFWWHSPTVTELVRNEEQGFAATLLDVATAISFSVETADFAFQSDPPEKSQALYARIGYSANGVYLPPEGGMATPTG